MVSLALLLWKPQTFAWCCGSNWPYLAWYKVRGHSITTWKGFDHFWPPFPLTGTILFNPIPHGFWTDIATFVGSFWPALLVSSATQWIAMPSSKTCTQIRSFIFRHHFVSLFQQSRKSDPPFLSVKLDFCLCIKTSKIRKTPKGLPLKQKKIAFDITQMLWPLWAWEPKLWVTRIFFINEAAILRAHSTFGRLAFLLLWLTPLKPLLRPKMGHFYYFQGQSC